MNIHFSISLNNRAATYLPNYTIKDLLRLAGNCDSLGFSAVWVHDSLLDSPRFEPIALLGALAVSTESIRIGTSILQPHFRNPVQLALSWATIDRLSDGRTILGVGIGGGTPKGIEKEVGVIGIKKSDRGVILEDTVQLLRRLWTEDNVTFHGKFYSFNDVSLEVKPIQRSPPIWIASGIYVPSDKDLSATPGYTSQQGGYRGVFDRVAKLADGWFTLMATPNEFKTAWRYIQERAADFGRDPDTLTPCQEFWINVNESSERAYNEVTEMIELYFNSKVSPETLRRWTITGTRSECIKKIELYVEAGVREFKFFLGSRDSLGLLRVIYEDIVTSF